jgi:hypothetical protein
VLAVRALCEFVERASSLFPFDERDVGFVVGSITQEFLEIFVGTLRTILEHERRRALGQGGAPV